LYGAECGALHHTKISVVRFVRKNGDSERYSPDCMDSMDFMEIAQVAYYQRITLESMG
jgi:hypothetical protein